MLTAADVPRSECSPSDVRLGASTAVEVRHVDDVAQRRQGGDDVGDVVGAVDVLGAVAVAVDGDQHARLDLGEAVDHRAHAELRCATRPDRSERGGGEEGDECLGDVGRVGDDTIAFTDAELAQCGRAAAHPEAQVVPGQLDGVACLTHGDDGESVWVGRSGRQRLVGVVERRTREPTHVGHLRAGPDRVRWRHPPDAGELRRRPPEGVEVVGRPADQRSEVVEAVLRREAAERRRLPGVVRRRPQHVAA